MEMEIHIPLEEEEEEEAYNIVAEDNTICKVEAFIISIEVVKEELSTVFD
jgi:hypothetical protein